MLLNALFFGLEPELTPMINGLTCFGFAGSSVGLQAEAICASASVRSLRVHTDLTACPIIPAFIMICGQQQGYLLHAKCAQTWPKYANPTLNVTIPQPPIKKHEYANACLGREGWVNCCFGYHNQFIMKSTTISLRFEFMHWTASFYRDLKIISAEAIFYEYSFLCLIRTAK